MILALPKNYCCYEKNVCELIIDTFVVLYYSRFTMLLVVNGIKGMLNKLKIAYC